MRFRMALFRAYGSTNAVYLGLDTKKIRINWWELNFRMNLLAHLEK